MTRNLKWYAAFSLTWSLPFYALLNWGVANANRRWPLFWAAAVVYGAGFALLGQYLGRRETGKIRYNIRAAYVATSFSVSALVFALWVVIWQPSQWPGLVGFGLISAVVVASVFVKFRTSVKGFNSRELFK